MFAIARRTTVLSLLIAAMSGCAPDPAATLPPPAPPPPAPTPDLVVRSLEIQPQSVPIRVGSTATFGFVARNAAGDTLSGATVTWYSSDPTTASVSAAGVITGVRAGTVTLMAASGSVAASILVTISAAPPGTVVARINIVGTPPRAVGFLAFLLAVAVDAQGVVVPDAPVTWTSTNLSVATVSSNGAVIAVGAGTTSITAAAGGAQSSISMSVVNLRISFAPTIDLGAQLYGYSANLAPGQTYQINATVLTAQGSPFAPQPTLTWRSDHPDVATVTPGGLVTAIANGAAQITASGQAATDADFSIHVQPVSGTSTIRLVHAAAEIGPLAFSARSGQLATLGVGDAREITVPAGMIQMTLDGVPSGHVASYMPFNGPLAPNQRYTFIAAGSGLYFPIIIPLLDAHPTVPAFQPVIRVVMAADYAATYNGNDLYFVAAGAPVPSSGAAFNDFELGAVLNWDILPGGTFDIVLVDVPTVAGGPATESARFTVSPTPGRATTYVITGTTKASLQIMKFEDP